MPTTLGGQLDKEWTNLIAPKHPFLHLFSLRIDTDDVKDVLCQIQADGGNLHTGLLSLRFDGKLPFLHHGA
jgi:hypothetical protein